MGNPLACKSCGYLENNLQHQAFHFLTQHSAQIHKDAVVDKDQHAMDVSEEFLEGNNVCTPLQKAPSNNDEQKVTNGGSTGKFFS